MLPASGRFKLAFAIGLTVYAAGIGFLVAIGAHAAWLAVALLDGIAAPAENAQRSQRLGARDQHASLPSAAAEGLMTTLADRLPDRWPKRGSMRFRAGLPSYSRNDDDE